MKVFLFSKNTMVIKIVESSVKSLQLPIEVHENLINLPDISKDPSDTLVFFDDGIGDVANIGQTDFAKVFIHEKSAKPSKDFDYSLKKPFLPSQVIEIIHAHNNASTKSSPQEKPENETITPMEEELDFFKSREQKQKDLDEDISKSFGEIFSGRDSPQEEFQGFDPKQLTEGIYKEFTKPETPLDAQDLSFDTPAANVPETSVPEAHLLTTQEKEQDEQSKEANLGEDFWDTLEAKQTDTEQESNPSSKPQEPLSGGDEFLNPQNNGQDGEDVGGKSGILNPSEIDEVKRLLLDTEPDATQKTRANGGGLENPAQEEIPEEPENLTHNEGTNPLADFTEGHTDPKNQNDSLKELDLLDDTELQEALKPGENIEIQEEASASEINKPKSSTPKKAHQNPTKDLEELDLLDGMELQEALDSRGSHKAQGPNDSAEKSADQAESTEEYVNSADSIIHLEMIQKSDLEELFPPYEKASCDSGAHDREDEIEDGIIEMERIPSIHEFLQNKQQGLKALEKAAISEEEMRSALKDKDTKASKDGQKTLEHIRVSEKSSKKNQEFLELLKSTSKEDLKELQKELDLLLKTKEE
ncbi:hypothetical protein [Helicobacter mustelae]|uniref:Uncharacterized protein n=1 Tax=Helicobacter mustelae (strain ATCC 43772 / CCUG 25715 / CIP 103759 / LMG 18044 / NCTC 12198 / R85-136P) TaxID=679897 RepID=D3UG72_HELM1|nr:hypothetical protein [Helicobacter mustelae]CBG39493.1 Putative hypothetical protein [Helicobacter mustelae 12198]SQH71005.1 poly E-rich protein [Helicobacter mustelae]STP12134.1 poly E-rich protein [Helicobacter mustelae]